MDESSSLREAAERFRSWSERAGLVESALAEYRRSYGDSRELFGVPMKDVRASYVFQSLVYHSRAEGAHGFIPLVDVLLALKLKKPPIREYAYVGSFTVTYKLDGSIVSTKAEFDDARLRQVAEIRKKQTEAGGRRSSQETE
jgi:hypothetical protein